MDIDYDRPPDDLEPVRTSRRGLFIAGAAALAAVGAIVAPELVARRLLNQQALPGTSASENGVIAGIGTGQTDTGYLIGQGATGERASRFTLSAVEQRTAFMDARAMRRAADLRARDRRRAGVTVQPITVTFAGNSMTAGYNIAGYRHPLPGAYQPYFVDRLDQLDYAVTGYVCAEVGRTLDQLRQALPGFLASHPSQLVLIHMGTTTQTSDLAGYQDRYLDLIDRALASSPSTRVVCALVQYSFPSSATYQGVQANEHAVNDYIRAATAARQATGRVALADASDVPQEWTIDGVHNGAAGNAAIADAFVDTIIGTGWLS